MTSQTLVPTPGPQEELQGPAEGLQEGAVYMAQCPLHLQGATTLLPGQLNAPRNPCPVRWSTSWVSEKFSSGKNVMGHRVRPGRASPWPSAVSM